MSDARVIARSADAGVNGARPARAFGVSALFVGAALLVVFVVSNVGASLAQRSLRDRWERVVATGAVAEPRPGDPVAQLGVPSIGLDVVVVEGPSSARGAPVHLSRTALPGTAGVSAIEAGRLGNGAFFDRLDRLDTGDAVLVRTPRGVVRYAVMDVRVVDERSIDLTSNGDAAILVLIAPASRLGGSERIVVRAREVAS